MRSMLATTLILVATAASAQAQMSGTAAVTGVKPKPVTTVPIRPALQTPADTANAMAQAERQAIQSDLAWVGDYNGAITGEVSERMVAAIKEFQKDRGGKQTGVLNPQERGVLAETAKRRQDNVGWKIVTDAGSGARLGIPTKLVPQQSSDANGAKWSSSTGTIQIVLARRKEAAPTTAKLAEQEKKEPGRKVEYTVVKPDFFVLSGLQGLKKFYVRGAFKGDEVRILTILYDQATENTVEPVVIAMSSAFNPFPSGAQIAGPPPRKTVEYGTGVVVSDDGAIVTDRQVVDACLDDYDRRPRQCRPRRRGQGSRSRAAANLWRARVKTACARRRSGEIRRRTDRYRRPAKSRRWRCGEQRQGGGYARRQRQRPCAVAGAGAGFFWRGLFWWRRQTAGIVLLKPLLVAGPPNAAPAAQATLVPVETVREFLKANGVNAIGGSANARASVVRVICVRK